MPSFERAIKKKDAHIIVVFLVQCCLLACLRVFSVLAERRVAPSSHFKRVLTQVRCCISLLSTCSFIYVLHNIYIYIYTVSFTFSDTARIIHSKTRRRLGYQPKATTTDFTQKKEKVYLSRRKKDTLRVYGIISNDVEKDVRKERTRNQSEKEQCDDLYARQEMTDRG